MLTLSADGTLSAEPVRSSPGTSRRRYPRCRSSCSFRSRPSGSAPGRVQLGGDVVANAHGISFSDASFRLNHGRFEGTLAIRRDDLRTTVEGTLATDLLDVDSLPGGRCRTEGSLASLYRRPSSLGALDANVDLRISATKARLGRLTLDDAALAVLFRDGRLDVSVDEAGLCGGWVKGRAVTHLGPGGAVAHAEATATKVDGRGLVGGSRRRRPGRGSAHRRGDARRQRPQPSRDGGDARRHGRVDRRQGPARRVSRSAARSTDSVHGCRSQAFAATGRRSSTRRRGIFWSRAASSRSRMAGSRRPASPCRSAAKPICADGRVDVAGTAVETRRSRRPRIGLAPAALHDARIARRNAPARRPCGRGRPTLARGAADRRRAIPALTPSCRRLPSA